MITDNSCILTFPCPCCADCSILYSVLHSNIISSHLLVTKALHVTQTYVTRTSSITHVPRQFQHLQLSPSLLLHTFFLSHTLSHGNIISSLSLFTMHTNTGTRMSTFTRSHSKVCHQTEKDMCAQLSIFHRRLSSKYSIIPADYNYRFALACLAGSNKCVSYLKWSHNRF